MGFVVINCPTDGEPVTAGLQMDAPVYEDATLSGAPIRLPAVRLLVPELRETSPDRLASGLRLGDRAPDARPYVALNMVSTLDGKATIDWRTRGHLHRARPPALPSPEDPGGRRDGGGRHGARRALRGDHQDGGAAREARGRGAAARAARRGGVGAARPPARSAAAERARAARGDRHRVRRRRCPASASR